MELIEDVSFQMIVDDVQLIDKSISHFSLLKDKISKKRQTDH